MNKTLKILGLGIASPLTLSMGHPVQDRVRRLARKHKLRGGAIVSALLVSVSLTLTGLAKSTTDEMALDDVSVIGTAFLIKYHNLDTGRKTLEVEFDSNSISFNLYKKTDNYAGAPFFEQDGPKLRHANPCVRHIAAHNISPLWYKTSGKVIETDSDDTQYLISCIPGSETKRGAMSTADIVQSVRQSGGLTTLEQDKLIARIKNKAASKK